MLGLIVFAPGAKQHVIKSSGICCTHNLFTKSAEIKGGNLRYNLALKSLFVVVVCCCCCCVYFRLRGLAALIHQSPVTFPVPPNCFIFYQAWCSVEDPPPRYGDHQSMYRWLWGMRLFSRYLETHCLFTRKEESRCFFRALTL